MRAMQIHQVDSRPIPAGMVLAGIRDQEQYYIDNSPGPGEWMVLYSFDWYASVTIRPVDEVVWSITHAFENAWALMSDEQRDWFEFEGYAADWKENRPHSSRVDQLASHPAYQRIIGMGPERAVPCILRQLRRELKEGKTDHWFWALWALTGASPVPKENRGKMRKMAEAWIQWGEREGYIDAEEMGIIVPTTGW